MITRTVDGLLFEVPSPSYWKLVGNPVDVSFIGSGWYLRLQNINGELTGGVYPTREEALGVIVGAFRNAGCLPS